MKLKLYMLSAAFLVAGLSVSSAQDRGGRGAGGRGAPTFERPDGAGERPDGAGERPDGAGERPDGAGERPSREEIAEKIKERLAARGIDLDEIKAKRADRKAKAGERREQERGDRRAAFRDRLKARRAALKERLSAAKAEVAEREE